MRNEGVRHPRTAILVALLWVLSPALAEARGLDTGFYDPVFASSTGPEWLERADAAGASIVRVSVSWPAVAPKRPREPRNPDDPAYVWEPVDATIAAAAARGLRIDVSFSSAPSWAHGRGPRRYGAAWKPEARAVGDFATALARRYASQVDFVQIWNEPNLALYLAPQWERRKGRLRSFAAVRYRAMLNAAYPGVHAAGAQLVTAGTAPYGDPVRGGDRTAPVRFWRTLLSERTRFDIAAHHPYGVRGPRGKAFNAQDVAVADVHKLIDLVKGARTVSNAAKRRFWVTEVSWDSRPPDPNGVPARRHARWLSDAFFVLWKQGVDTVLWFRTGDEPKGESYATTNQSGVYFADGRPKPALRAFLLPFSCEPAGTGTRVWLRAPSAGPVAVLDGSGARVKTLRPGGDRIAVARVAGRGAFSARAGALRSVTCRS